MVPETGYSYMVALEPFTDQHFFTYKPVPGRWRREGKEELRKMPYSPKSPRTRDG